MNKLNNRLQQWMRSGFCYPISSKNHKIISGKLLKKDRRQLKIALNYGVDTILAPVRIEIGRIS